MSTIDQDRYNALADWAESDEPELSADTPTATDDRSATHDLIRRAGGRPSLDPDASKGNVSPRRQVRLPADLSRRLDAYAEQHHLTTSAAIRQAVAAFLDSHDNISA